MNKTYSGAWLKKIEPQEKPFLIAGPCSAETEEQVLKTAHDLKDSSVHFFRAGIWKPRTRPGGFEGIGVLGLKWLQRVKNETGLKTATEVANRDHARLALEHDVDLLWIGARSTVSPFIVQEIADELAGTDKIVLVKNPVNPDLSLWIGALERFERAGIKNLGVIHRGFSTYEKTKFRNIPEWQIAIDLQNRFPDLPIICDPSHIAGNRDLICEISQTALDLNFNGLMIETHCNPDSAWSDAMQQITPQRLKEILNELIIRNPNTSENEFHNQLEGLRSQIDILDQQLLEILRKRMKIADNIGQLKKQKNIAVLQNKRWSEILERMIFLGKKQGFSEEFVSKLFKAIHQESIDRQEGILYQK
ncbi:MAG: bifunctional 3-deoxy-7-phosphoheptulonate synthase/chorismate mutase type II [Flavobacteriaceae bacterium]|nr:bifunctional 3-deoxy-7-phosphoheptulonate synthase/chorismate mutase type II [Flavobacteriaceae bacterium]